MRSAAVSARDVWVVGCQMGGNGTTKKAVTLAEHWDGSHWRVVPSPSLQADGNSLASVAAVSAHDVWAAGSGRTKSSTSPLLLHWDGVRWSLAGAANFTGAVTGIAAISAHDVWAVSGAVMQWPTSSTSTLCGQCGSCGQQ